MRRRICHIFVLAHLCALGFGCVLFDDVERPVGLDDTTAPPALDALDTGPELEELADLADLGDTRPVGDLGIDDMPPDPVEMRASDLGMPDLVEDMAFDADIQPDPVVDMAPDSAPDIAPDIAPDVDMMPDLPLPCPAAEVDHDVDPTTSYLRLHPSDVGADPLRIDLGAQGYRPGDTLEMRAYGYFHRCDDLTRSVCASQRKEVIAVFSGSATLLAPDQLLRVADAIETGLPDILTQASDTGNLTTDISEDFRVQASSTRVAIPAGATHLFVGVRDGRYINNVALVPFGLRLRCRP